MSSLSLWTRAVLYVAISLMFRTYPAYCYFCKQPILRRQVTISLCTPSAHPLTLKSWSHIRQKYALPSLSSAHDSNTEKPPHRQLPNPYKSLKAMLLQLRNIQRVYATRFKSLSRKSKIIVLTQFLLMFGGVTSVMSKYYSYHGPPTPIEISYSSFIDLIEQKAVWNNPTTNGIAFPKIDQVRIGSDRITYKLYNNVPLLDEQAKSPVDVDRNLLKNSKPAMKPIVTPRKTKITSSAIKIHGKELQNQPTFVQAYTKKVAASPELLHLLRTNDISFAAAVAPRASTVAVAARTVLIGFYFIILFRLYKTISGASGKNDPVGKFASNINRGNLPYANFDDIQGIDNAKAEVMELVDVIRNPDKYAILGARAPTGLLLVGPPGTGKTMLARATAATAGVPLLYCSGSDFVEMFVGRGAARVRQLFDRASKLAPCIVFVDELDALGKSRDFGNGFMSRSNDEAEQTLNQLLACMDGLDSSRQVCVLAATNRKEVLDPALIRPGRFDRIVKLELPNAIGREQILRVHTSKLPGFVEGSGLDGDRTNALGKGRFVDLSAVAAVTEGFSGAELEFLVNEAAIRAVRRVSSALQQGKTPLKDIVPHVEARDFEESLRAFYETRNPAGARTPSMNNILKNVWKQ